MCCMLINTHRYRLASNFEQRLKTSQSDANFDFYSIQDPTKMFYFLTDVLTPAVTTQSYYNGEPFPDNGGDPLDYQGNYFSDDVGLTLGKIRVSQVCRMHGIPERVSNQWGSRYE